MGNCSGALLFCWLYFQNSLTSKTHFQSSQKSIFSLKMRFCDIECLIAFICFRSMSSRTTSSSDKPSVDDSSKPTDDVSDSSQPCDNSSNGGSSKPSAGQSQDTPDSNESSKRKPLNVLLDAKVQSLRKVPLKSEVIIRRVGLLVVRSCLMATLSYVTIVTTGLNF